jgi:hypothetical protein
MHVARLIVERRESVGTGANLLGISIRQINPNSAVENEVMSEEQTFRSEDNAFLPLSSGQLSLLFITTLNQ